MKKIFTLLATAILIFSCGGDKDDDYLPPNPIPTPNPIKKTISINPVGLGFDVVGGRYDVTVTSSDFWELIDGESWCVPTKKTGTNGDIVSFKTDVNTSTEERNATFTFTCGDETAKLTVTQKQKDALTLTSSKFEIPVEGKEITIEIKANVDYEYEIAEDCKSWITPIAATSRAMQSSYLKFNVAVNESTKKREGKITIESRGVFETINIYQEGATPTLIITQDNYDDIPAEGKTIKVELNTNIDYQVQMPNTGWVTEANTSMSTHTHYYTIAPNATIEPRTAKIVYYNNTHSKREEVTITQKADLIENLIQTVHVPTKGALSNILMEQKLTNVNYLRITGVLNDVDIIAIRNLSDLIYLDISGINITVLPDRAFRSASKVQKIVLPQTLTEIGENMFSLCSALKEIILGTNIGSIGSSAFSGCTSLTKIEIPASVNTIGSSAFSGCTSLTKIEIPAGLETIRNGCFRDCTSLAVVTFGKDSSLSIIDVGAFQNCTSLSNIEIPASVTMIEDSAFYNCTSLKTITFANDSQLITIVGNVNKYRYGVFENCTSLTSIEIPASVETIGFSAFKGCTSLISVTFENKSRLETIQGGSTYNCGVFENCTSLTSIKIPANVEVIERATFKNCTALTTVSFEDGSQLKHIRGHTGQDYYGAFSGCTQLKTVDATACVLLESVENCAFFNTNIDVFYLGATSIPLLGDYYPFDYLTASVRVLKVPDSSVGMYKNSSWKKYFSTISGFND